MRTRPSPSEVLLSPNTPYQQRLKYELTTRYLVELLVIYGVGWEVNWIRPAYDTDQLYGNRWREQFRKQCEAESFYEDKLRDIHIDEAAHAFGLTR